MRIDILTIFPGMFAGTGPLGTSIVGRAVERGIVDLRVHDLRDWTPDRHRSIDDYPYGGGAGMVMKAPPVVAAIEAVLGDDAEREPRVPVLLMSAAGRPFTQALAHVLANQERFVLLCGHYEGVDERAIHLAVTDEVSIGDYVLTGGELPAMVITDAVARLLPGVIEAESLAEESFADGLLEYPHYTRPPKFRGLTVPEVLTSGNHARILRWRREQALLRTRARRPDLLIRTPLTDADRRFLAMQQEGSGPLIRKVDCIQIPVPNLDAGLAFYRDGLGHSLNWRTGTAAGLRMADTETEIVLQMERPVMEPNLLVHSADAAAAVFVEAGGTMIVPPFDIQIGRCAVVQDPWGNSLVLLDLSKGLLVTDANGNVIGNAPPQGTGNDS